MLWLLATAGWAEPYEEIPGRWYPNVYRAPDASGLTPEEAAQVAQLDALGYLGGYEPDDPESGVVTWDRDRAYNGFSLYSSGHAAEAVLVGMDGQVVHRWAKSYQEVFPGHPAASIRDSGAWRRVALRPSDGHLLAVWEGYGLVHLDAHSNVVWATADRAHHEARWLDDGGVLVLTRVLHAGQGPGDHALYEDFVAQLDPAGREIRRVSVLKALRESPWASLLQRAPTDSGDLLHTNALFPLDQVRPDGVAGPHRVLLSFRHLDALAVLDLDEERLVWASTGTFAHQHDAEITPRGELMVFDNRGGVDGTSRVLAMEPWTLRPLWSYAGPPGHRLVSEVLGAAQELPNGDLLVTESTRGRALEVAPGGDVVWEYHNPRTTGPNGAYVAAIFEMIRLPADAVLPWL